MLAPFKTILRKLHYIQQRTLIRIPMTQCFLPPIVVVENVYDSGVHSIILSFPYLTFIFVLRLHQSI